MNEFSIVCRILGTLLHRDANDAAIAPLLEMIRANKLAPHWPLKQEALLTRLAHAMDETAISQDYQQLFAQNGAVSPFVSDYIEVSETEIRAALQQIGFPLTERAADHLGQLLLAASWIEDNAHADEIKAQSALFQRYILPAYEPLLGKVEAHATTAFYRTLAVITREAIAEMAQDIAESEADITEQESSAQ